MTSKTRDDKKLCQGYNYFCLPKSGKNVRAESEPKRTLNSGVLVVKRNPYFEHKNVGNC